jgi:hypothetical protein
MNCSSSQLPVFSIYLGDAKQMNLAAIYSDFGGPLDLTSCTEIVINLPNEDGTFLQLKLSTADVTIQTPEVLGKFYATITALQSALLNVGELQTFNVTFTISGQVFTVPYVNSLSVFETEP